MSPIDDGLEPRATQPIDGEGGGGDGHTSMQANMAGYIARISGRLENKGKRKVQIPQNQLLCQSRKAYTVKVCNAM